MAVPFEKITPFYDPLLVSSLDDFLADFLYTPIYSSISIRYTCIFLKSEKFNFMDKKKKKKKKYGRVIRFLLLIFYVTEYHEQYI